MSRHSAPTLVRIFEGNDRVANLLVDDWEDEDGQAEFTIPSDHPRADWLMDRAFTREPVTVLVMASDDIEWVIDRVNSGHRRDHVWPHPDWLRSYHRVGLTSRVKTLRNTQPEDWRCIQIFGVEEAPAYGGDQ
jgi:hypothetical protein